MKDILTFDDPSTLVRADEIDITTEGKLMKEIIKELKDTLRKTGVKHLSAPAIGYNKRIFCIDYEDLEIKTYINPMIANSEGLVLSRETSPCEPGKTFLIPRNTEIDIFYQRPTGNTENKRLLGLAATLAQQEFNMLDGILLSNLGLEIDEDFDNASEEDQNAIINMYLDSLDLQEKDLTEDIKSDPYLSKIDEGIKFMQSVAKGETVLTSSFPERENNGSTVSHQTETDN